MRERKTKETKNDQLKQEKKHARVKPREESISKRNE